MTPELIRHLESLGHFELLDRLHDVYTYNPKVIEALLFPQEEILIFDNSAISTEELELIILED